MLNQYTSSAKQCYVFIYSLSYHWPRSHKLGGFVGPGPLWRHNCEWDKQYVTKYYETLTRLGIIFSVKQSHIRNYFFGPLFSWKPGAKCPTLFPSNLVPMVWWPWLARLVTLLILLKLLFHHILYSTRTWTHNSCTRLWQLGIRNSVEEQLLRAIVAVLSQRKCCNCRGQKLYRHVNKLNTIAVHCLPTMESLIYTMRPAQRRAFQTN